MKNMHFKKSNYHLRHSTLWFASINSELYSCCEQKLMRIFNLKNGWWFMIYPATKVTNYPPWINHFLRTLWGPLFFFECDDFHLCMFVSCRSIFHRTNHKSLSYLLWAFAVVPNRSKKAVSQWNGWSQLLRSFARLLLRVARRLTLGVRRHRWGGSSNSYTTLERCCRGEVHHTSIFIA
jgi:hypothetical protein